MKEEGSTETQKGMVLKISEADPGFKYEFSKASGAEKIMLCFRCGTCNADCPVGKRVQVDEFNPRRITRLALLGLKDALLPGNMLWLCTGCYTCYERCPQDVKPTDVIVALRNIAVSEGYMPSPFKALIEGIARNGYIYEITDFENEIRADIGLPAAPQVNLDEVRKIMKKTGLDKLTGITLKEGS